LGQKSIKNCQTGTWTDMKISKTRKFLASNLNHSKVRRVFLNSPELCLLYLTTESKSDRRHYNKSLSGRITSTFKTTLEQ